eukprot:3254794-Prymnesium_polylepis.1
MGLSPVGMGLSPVGMGLSPVGMGLSPVGMGSSPVGLGSNARWEWFPRSRPPVYVPIPGHPAGVGSGSPRGCGLDCGCGRAGRGFGCHVAHPRSGDQSA